MRGYSVVPSGVRNVDRESRDCVLLLGVQESLGIQILKDVSSHTLSWMQNLPLVL
jgi:hypothetical protein